MATTRVDSRNQQRGCRHVVVIVHSRHPCDVSAVHHGNCVEHAPVQVNGESRVNVDQVLAAVLEDAVPENHARAELEEVDLTERVIVEVTVPPVEPRLNRALDPRDVDSVAVSAECRACAVEEQGGVEEKGRRGVVRLVE